MMLGSSPKSDRAKPTTNIPAKGSDWRDYLPPPGCVVAIVVALFILFFVTLLLADMALRG